MDTRHVVRLALRAIFIATGGAVGFSAVAPGAFLFVVQTVLVLIVLFFVVRFLWRRIARVAV